MLTYLQAVVIGLVQGVTELFPVSSLGHSVLLPALVGGSWKALVTQSTTSSSESSPYLAFIVALHVASAVALLVFFRQDWIRIISGFLRTLRPSVAARRIVTRDADERLAWLLVVATIPVGITGLALEHTFRTLFAKPLAAAVFLTINGVILLAGERLRRRAPGDDDQRAEPEATGVAGTDASQVAVQQRVTPRRQLATLSYTEAGIIGFFQTFALLAGISRSGISMVGGLARGLSHRDAARFSFLLATPVILAAGLLKLPSLAGPAGAQIHGQVLVGAVVAGVASYVSVRFLTRWFETRTLTPFAIYSLVAGAACIVVFA
ncbi:undecaprenyl-diphosphate phosphatase [Pedococcus sp.]|uniref:undecaprenyl-diphosphate phosphatase n=1 Tax=Pedococcus sp. TaxID=2860345 RepID=UPI002E156E35|nr:undecaprenyl-diphosphate phosphatase [Pedococcus sp.]